MEQENTVQNMPTARFWEIDAARGIAILMMITYHLLYDLVYFGVADIAVTSGFWRAFALTCACTFVFLVGLSLHISRERALQKGMTGSSLTWKYLMRGAFILALGCGITVVTWYVIGGGYILFGILHLIGLSICLSPFFFSLQKKNLIAGVIVIALSLVVTGTEGPLWLAWLGIHPAGFYSVDYEPLIPWFGIVLLGLGTGAYLYPEGRSLLQIKEPCPPVTGLLAAAGRHSLFIYIIHQPVIILVMLVAGVIPPGTLGIF
ncbi:DUF1624 domain-containing protein [Methanogenium organophilum]|uniref:Heparan-alpha-glucosaminide N-acetyltransferase n=1 Tax=Methanogenium organophilum TaxID=2199 RepID=A0A9X9S4G5_METOG|nr:heparan-alpha-glucosaminide N-acetyltransferase [Methanogenium organophilum]WAI01501.1 heparan-alpha-glucosaminide N-acetyltransferase [Methanogenium organophilum]